MNNIFISEGNVGNHFSLNTVEGKDGTTDVLNFTLRCQVDKKTDEGYKDVGGFWVEVEYWGGRAKMTHNLLAKGAKVHVVGSQRVENWTPTEGDHAGQTLAQTKVHAQSVTFSPLGIERIEYRPRKGGQSAPSDHTSEQASSGEEFE